MSYTLAYTGAEIDALLGKIDAIFVAEYGSTIYSEVTAAIAAGNKVIVANAGKVFVYAGTDDNGGYVFTQSGPNAAKPNATYVTLSTGNVWSTATVDLATLQQFYASLMEDTASGSIASFPDGAENVPVKELTADIEPIQDLHGYDNPWPLGGSKNIIPMTLAILKTANPEGTWSGNTYTRNGVAFAVNADDGGNVLGIAVTCTNASANTSMRLCAVGTLPVAEGGSYLLSGNNGAGGNGVIRVTDNTTATYTNNSNTDTSFTVPTGWVSASALALIYISSGATFSGHVFYPMVRLSTVSDATYIPPSNICPITGYTGAEIPVTGKNLYNKNGTGDGFVAGNALLVGNTLDANQYFNVSEYIKIKPSTAYTLQSLIGNAAALCFYDANKGYISGSIYGGETTKTITSPATAAYIRFSVPVANVDTIQLEEGSSATAYEPFGTVYSVSWTDHGTVYKGTAQYKGGGEWEITPTWGWIDLSTATWEDTGAQYWRTTAISTLMKLPASGTELGNMIAEDYKNRIAQAFYNASVGEMCVGPTGNLQVKTADMVNKPEGLLIYELATPTTFTVSGPDPETLLGDNNMWSNTGDISVKYRCNTALYIEKKLGE